MPYRYEDLGDEKRFQKLCQALLATEFTDLRCMPVGEADGGRDGVQPATETGKRLIFQVKWTRDPSKVKESVTWLKAAIAGEDENIRRLVAEGVDAYYIVTNVRGTGRKKAGTIDRLDEELADLSKTYGVRMQAWWRDDLDARVATAPDGLKFDFSEILVGTSAFLAFLERRDSIGRLKRLDRILRTATATQWSEDETVRFKQAGLDASDLSALFVDVEMLFKSGGGAESEPRGRPGRGMGAAGALLSSNPPLRSLVFGAPGQGKSTLVQFVCQAHRALLLGKDHPATADGASLVPALGRIVFRVDLRDYALWVAGFDPFHDTEPRPRRAKTTTETVEGFLAHCLSRASGGHDVSVDDIHEVIDRYPTLLAFDGLDEVADEKTRSRVVTQIEQALDRFDQLSAKPVTIVTTRPSYSQLPEPSERTFERFELQPLSEKLRISYLRKWATSHNLVAADRRSLERVFRKRSGEPHVQDLATNPMQLAILLYLVHRQEEALPTDRTRLYTAYMTVFLDRESAKSPDVSTYRPLLEEITAYLGWHLQAAAEHGGGSGRLTTAELRRLLGVYLLEEQKDTTLVDVLFSTATTRVWVLVSRTEGTFEFAVQSIREYFAARHIAENAPPVDGRDKFARISELAIRPYWLNCARFMAGFFSPGELGTLSHVLEDLTQAESSPFWSRRFARTIISDGAFERKTQSQNKAVEALDNLSIQIFGADLFAGTCNPFTSGRGQEQLAERLRNQIANDPGDPLTPMCAQLLVRHMPAAEVADWWYLDFPTDPHARPAWLRIAAAAVIGSHLSPTQTATFATETASEFATDLLAAGVTPLPGTPLDTAMLKVALDGTATEIAPGGSSLAADLLRIFHPLRLLARTPFRDSVADNDQNFSRTVNDRAVTAASRRLRERGHVDLTDSLRPRRGQKGTVSTWGNAARQLTRAFGPNWLANEIAIIGASATELNPGGDITTGTSAFGPQADLGRLITEIRSNRNSPTWWSDSLAILENELDRRTWALALITCATDESIVANAAGLVAVLDAFPEAVRLALEFASMRIGCAGAARTVDTATVNTVNQLSARTAGTLAHHLPSPEQSAFALGLPRRTLDTLAGNPAVGHPLLRASWKHHPDPGQRETDLLSALMNAGPAIELPDNGIQLSENAAEGILRDHVRYSWQLLAASDHVLATANKGIDLLDVATANAWFTE